MKTLKIGLCSLLSVCLLMSLTACGKKEDGMVPQSEGSETMGYKDGEYKAAESKYDDDGYKDTVKIVIKNGKLYSVDCDADHKEGGTKKADSESGKYNMKAGGAQYHWHEEIAAFERFVTEKGIEAVKMYQNGKTDSVTGCTIVVSKYVELIKEAMKKAEM